MAPVFNSTSHAQHQKAAFHAFVGRAAELETLRAATARFLAGTGQMVLVAGPPGIGKTRLAERIASESAEKGSSVLWGRSWEGGGAPAYWPWTQVVRQCFAILKSTGLAEGFSPAARYLAKLFPDSLLENSRSQGPGETTAEDLTVISSRAGEGEEQARFRLFDSIGSFLKRIAREVPLTIVLDDLHAADADSLLLFKFLARDLRNRRIFLIGTFREIETKIIPYHAELMSDIAREGHLVTMQGLSRTEVAEFLQSYFGQPSDAFLVSELFRTTEGNPLLLVSVVTLMQAEATKDHALRSLTSFELPHGLSATIRRSISPLSDRCKSILGIASVIGKMFDFVLLQRVSKVSDDDLLDILGEAARIGIVTEESSKPGQFSFSHSTIRETLVGDLPKATLRRLHKMIAGVIEEIHRSELEPHLAELAYHHFQALPIGTTAKAIEYATRGASRALGQLAYEEAVRLYSMALNASAADSPADQVRRCQLLLGLGKAQSKAGSIRDSRDSFLQAAELAQEVGQSDLLALAAIGATAEWGIPGTVIQRQVDLLREALDAQGPDQGVLRALLIARLANELFWSENREIASTLSEQALKIARNAGDQIALASAIWTRNATLWSPDNLDERLAGAGEIVRLAETVGNLEWNLKGRDLRLVSLLEKGEVARLDREIDEYLRIVEEASLSSPRPHRFRAMRAVMNTELERAEQFAEHALAIDRSRQSPGALIAYEAQLMLIRTAQGRLAEMEPMLRRRVSEFPSLVVMRCGLAACYANLGRTHEARAEFEVLAADNFQGIQRDWNWLGAISMASTACAFLNDAARAEILYEMVLPYADRNVTVGWGEACYGSASQVLGALATVNAKYEKAEEHFDKAITDDFAMGARGFAASAQCACAEMLIRRGLPDDRKKVAELCASAAQIARDLDSEPLAILSAQIAQRLAIPEPSAESSDNAASLASGNWLRNEGDFWLIRFESREFRVKSVSGMNHLAQLLRNPGVEFHGLQLSAPESASKDAQPLSDSEEDKSANSAVLQDFGTSRIELGDAGPMIDPQARASYGSRLKELRSDLEDSNERGDTDRAEWIREEIEAIARELSRAVGLGGRDRRASSASERARLNVTRAIRAAIEKISKVCPELGEMLSTAVRTGTFFCYTIDPNKPVLWDP